MLTSLWHDERMRGPRDRGPAWAARATGSAPSFQGLFGRESVARCYDSRDRLGPARFLLAAALLTDHAQKENP